MIQALNIKNFQSHKTTHLKFSSGVNIIIGASDSGKSSIIRALRWLIWNKPLGNDFRSDWGGKTNVSIEIDSNIISRLKSNGVNGYELGAMLLQTIGTEVPPEIQQILNLNEVNLQQQLDSHFLLSATPGEVGQHFNRIAHIDQIDKGLKNIKNWITQIQQDIKSENKLIKENEEKLKPFDYLDKYEIELEVLEGMEVQKSSKINKKNNLERLITQIKLKNEEIEQESKLINLEVILKPILSDFKQREEFIKEYNNLIELIECIEGNEQLLDNYKQLFKLETPLLNILNLIQQRNEKEKELNKLSNLKETINKNEDKSIILKDRIKQLEDRFHELMPNICPLCGKPK